MNDNPPCKDCISYALCNARLRDNIRDTYSRKDEIGKLSSNHEAIIIIAYQTTLTTCDILRDYIITSLHEEKALSENRIPGIIKESMIIKCLYKAFNLKSKDLVI